MKTKILSDEITISGYNPEKGEWVKRRNCCNMQNLRLANREFHLTYKDGYYFMAVEDGDEMYSVWFIKDDDIMPNEAVSMFRKEYLKRGITPEMMDLFLKNPPEYTKKYNKSKPTKK